MRTLRIPIVALATVAALAGCAADEEHHDHEAGSGPRLYDNLGNHHRPITTSVAEVQRWFDQGLRLSYAFNHAEAVRAFEQAFALDSACGICAWGIGYALGPNINAPMPAEAERRAHAAAALALARVESASPAEQALIRALALRYAAEPAADARAGHDSAYATAMGEAALRYPDDDDVQSIAAEALMNLSPWDYWNRDGSPRPATRLILRSLEAVVARNPDHPGACHFYIHAVEAHHAERAIACAERLANLMPGAGHLVHMPGHVYIRVGRWNDAIRANEHAVHADDSYFEGPQTTRSGLYGQGYAPHNWHFMAFAATMAGNRETALLAARRVVEAIDPEVAQAEPLAQGVLPILVWSMITFGEWDSVLAQPMPAATLPFARGMTWYARGVAHAALGREAEARAALDSVTTASAAWGTADPLGQALHLAGIELQGQIALRGGRLPEAIARFREAAALEDGIMYMEPPFWFYPIRHSLGKALLEAGRAQEAERLYRQDLARFPENAWSLTGLRLSLERQGRSAEAAGLASRLETATGQSGVVLASSRF